MDTPSAVKKGLKGKRKCFFDKELRIRGEGGPTLLKAIK